MPAIQENAKHINSLPMRGLGKYSKGMRIQRGGSKQMTPSLRDPAFQTRGWWVRSRRPCIVQ